MSICHVGHSVCGVLLWPPEQTIMGHSRPCQSPPLPSAYGTPGGPTDQAHPALESGRLFTPRRMSNPLPSAHGSPGSHLNYPTSTPPHTLAEFSLSSQIPSLSVHAHIPSPSFHVSVLSLSRTMS